MAQQSFNYLIKLVGKADKMSVAERQKTFTGPLEHLGQLDELPRSKCQAREMRDFLNIDTVTHTFKVCVAAKISSVCRRFNNLLAAGVSRKDAVNSHLANDIVQVSREHVRLMTVLLFKENVERRDGSNKIKTEGVRSQLERLCLLYALDCIQRSNINVLYECGYFEARRDYSSMILAAIVEVNSQVRPYAIGLIESVTVSDDVLLSAVGNSYGDIYE